MNDFSRMTRMAEHYRKLYPEGTRIEVNYMGDDPHPIDPGTRGTVRHVDDMGTIHCHFDNGRHLGLVPEIDSFRTLTSRELAEERGHIPLEDQMKAAAIRAAEKRTPDKGKEGPLNHDHV